MMMMLCIVWMVRCLASVGSCGIDVDWYLMANGERMTDAYRSLEHQVHIYLIQICYLLAVGCRAG